MAITIGAMLLAGSLLFYADFRDQRRLEDPVAEIKTMAREAARLSRLEQLPMAISFQENVIGLGVRGGPAGYRYQLAEDVSVKVRREQQNDWQEADGAQWIFEATGLNEPLFLRFERERSWVQLTFGPLNGEVVEEEFAIY